MKGEPDAPRQRKRKHPANLPAEAQARRKATKNDVSVGFVRPDSACSILREANDDFLPLVDSFSSVNPHLSLALCLNDFDFAVLNAGGRFGRPPTGRVDSVRRLSSIPCLPGE
jgi:hypothetical protein